MVRRLPTTHRRAIRIAVTFIMSAIAVACFAPLPVKAAQNSDELAALLSKTRSQVEQFAQQFSYLRYDDDVVKAKLKNNGKVAYKQEIVYDTLLRMRFDDGKLRVNEQRLIAQPPRKLETRPLLDTYGFSTLEIIFHPYYASSFQFTSAGSGEAAGRLLEKVAFQHVPHSSSPILYQSLAPDRPLDISGTAWIDPASGGIYRIVATITSGIGDAGIKAIDISVAFEPITLQDQTEPEILPATATIDLETPRQHWRTVHKFSDYRKYRVAVNLPGGDTR
jgi:hypothetical protein